MGVNKKVKRESAQSSKKGATSVTLSMSGFGSGSARNKAQSISVELRSLNSRFFDCSVRLPGALSGTYETKIRESLEKSLQRGRVEVIVTVALQSSEGVRASFNERLFEESFQVIRRSKTVKRVLDDDEIAEALLARKEIFDLVRDEQRVVFDERLLWNALDLAVNQLLVMRRREGQRLAIDLYERLAELEQIVVKLSALAKSQNAKQRTELLARIAAVSATVALDSQRLEQEVAILVAKSDVHEELVRLGSHLQEFKRLMQETASGKRLEFLTQEFLRELNTIGSKQAMALAQHAVVAGKGVVERIKEQVQNVA